MFTVHLSAHTHRRRASKNAEEPLETVLRTMRPDIYRGPELVLNATSQIGKPQFMESG